eukprot:symbB.v1.2.011743.t1/scaffold796.1/size162622/2
MGASSVAKLQTAPTPSARKSSAEVSRRVVLEALEEKDEERALQAIARPGVSLEETNQVGHTPLLEARWGLILG